MKKAWETILFALFACVCAAILILVPAPKPVQAQNTFTGIVCDTSAKYSNNTNGATQLQGSSGGSSMYICGYSINWGGTATTVTLVFGTTVSTPCDTGQTAITPGFVGSSSTPPIVDHIATYGGIPVVPAGKNLCVLTNAGQTVNVVVYFSQRS